MVMLVSIGFLLAGFALARFEVGIKKNLGPAI
jgi:hypothetical protein